ncbi:hypothetical protein NPIL_540131 [Nephila pilipes]|uniref:Uncharacterized protein n=1 Tax=Nephila pilipes TaxID=299642 RepID=A0A8X6TC87_NEPPI|nr:hypothetical protein NPIL_540131 [Nephila pilipes]
MRQFRLFGDMRESNRCLKAPSVAQEYKLCLQRFSEHRESSPGACSLCIVGRIDKPSFRNDFSCSISPKAPDINSKDVFPVTSLGASLKTLAPNQFANSFGETHHTFHLIKTVLCCLIYRGHRFHTYVCEGLQRSSCCPLTWDHASPSPLSTLFNINQISSTPEPAAVASEVLPTSTNKTIAKLRPPNFPYRLGALIMCLPAVAQLSSNILCVLSHYPPVE